MGLELVKATNAAWAEIRYAGVVDWWSKGRELSAEMGESNTSIRVDRGAISQCMQRRAGAAPGAKWQAVEDQRGEDQRDRATSSRRLREYSAQVLS